MYRSGMTLDQVAAHFGVAGPTIWRRLQGAGVETRRPGMPLGTELDVEQVAALYVAGCTLDEVAALVEVSSGTVRRRLIDMGVELRSSGGRWGLDMDALAAQAAEVLGRPVEAVRPLLKGAPDPEPQPEPEPLLVDVDWCRQMVAEGHGVDEIADWLGVSADALGARLDADPGPPPAAGDD